MYAQFRDKGLEIIAQPCNQFNGQEPGTNSEIKEQARECYEAKFPLLAKSEVNGSNTTELFQFLRRNSSLYNPETGLTKQVPWNFTKFVVDRSGSKVLFFSPRATEEEVQAAIESML